MSDCQRCGHEFASTNAKFCAECGHHNSWTENEIDRPDALKKYVTALPSIFFDLETSSEALNAFSLSLRERFKISFQQHQTIFAALTEKKNALAAMLGIGLEFDENVLDAYAGHDTHLRFRLNNPQTSAEIFKVTLEWDDPETPDHQDYKVSSAGFLKPGQHIEVAGTHMFMRAGPKEISELILTLENQFFDKARFLVFPFRFKVANSGQQVVNNITTHNQISIEGRGVVDASGAGTAINQDKVDAEPHWVPLKFSLILDDDFYAFIDSKVGVERALQLEQNRIIEEKRLEEERHLAEQKRREDEELQRRLEERERQIQEKRLREEEEKKRIENQKAQRKEEERLAEQRRAEEDAKQKVALEQQQKEKERQIAEERRRKEDERHKQERERQAAEQKRIDERQRKAAEEERAKAEKKQEGKSSIWGKLGGAILIAVCVFIGKQFFKSDSKVEELNAKIETTAPKAKRLEKPAAPSKKPSAIDSPSAIPLSEQSIAHVSVYGVRGSRAAAWNVRVAPQKEIDESVKKSCEQYSNGTPCERLLSGHFNCVAVFNGSNNFVWSQAGNTLDEATSLGAARCQEKNGSACTLAENGSRCVDSSISVAPSPKPYTPQAKTPEFVVPAAPPPPPKTKGPQSYAAVYVNPDTQYWGGSVGYSGAENTDERAKQGCESNGGACRKYSSGFASCYAVYKNSTGKGIWVKLGGSSEQVVNEGKAECESFFGSDGSPCKLSGDINKLCAPEKK